MSEKLPNKPTKYAPDLADEIGQKARRKIRSRRRDKSDSAWFGLGMMGLIGWSVVVPTLLGTGLGLWLDKNHPVAHNWTLSLLVVGLMLGCVNAWAWVSKESKAMQEKEEDDDE